MKNGQIIFTLTASSLQQAKNQAYEQYCNDPEIIVYGE